MVSPIGKLYKKNVYNQPLPLGLQGHAERKRYFVFDNAKQQINTAPY